MKLHRNVIATAAVPLREPNLSMLVRLTQFGPFQARSFRFQWPADLLTSWGFEMENLILGWYVLAQTGSVLILTLFGSLQYIGTLIAPLIGMAGDRIGHRAVLCAMRAWYTALSFTLTGLAFGGLLRPAHVIIIAALSGLARMSDLAMRNALVAETVPVERFVSAMGAERMTSDSARAAAPLAGAGLIAVLGMGRAYLAIVAVYALGFLLTRQVGGTRGVARPSGNARSSVRRDLRQGLAYAWNSPTSLAALCLAILVNATAWPFTSGLLPYVAREIYHIDETGLGSLVAAFAIGSLLGSLVVSLASRVLRPGRMMVAFAVVWYLVLFVWGFIPNADGGRLALLIAGFAQSLCLVPMAVMLLHGAGEFRGRIMGLRMMAIYGLPFGLMLAGTLIERMGFAVTTMLYTMIGIVATLAIAWHWRNALWAHQAPANGQ